MNPEASGLAALLAVLGRIERHLAELPTAIAAAVAAQRRMGITREDQDLLAGLLPAIRAACGSSLWTQMDLERQSADYPDLQVALALAKERGFDRRRLGRVLLRSVGHEINGLTIAKHRPSRDGQVWSVREFHTR